MSSPSVVWPSLDAYQNAVLHPKRNLKDARLHSMQVELRAYGVSKLPFGRSGNFGSVYKFSNQHQAYALKVFLSAEADRQLRYRLIDQHLESWPASANLVSFGYEDQGILVQGRWYPSLTMDWVAGHPLDRYLSETLKRPPFSLFWRSWTVPKDGNSGHRRTLWPAHTLTGGPRKHHRPMLSPAQLGCPGELRRLRSQRKGVSNINHSSKV